MAIPSRSIKAIKKGMGQEATEEFAAPPEVREQQRKEAEMKNPFMEEIDEMLTCPVCKKKFKTMQERDLHAANSHTKEVLGGKSAKAETFQDALKKARTPRTSVVKANGSSAVVNVQSGPINDKMRQDAASYRRKESEAAEKAAAARARGDRGTPLAAFTFDEVIGNLMVENERKLNDPETKIPLLRIPKEGDVITLDEDMSAECQCGSKRVRVTRVEVSVDNLYRVGNMDLTDRGLSNWIAGVCADCGRKMTGLRGNSLPISFFEEGLKFVELDVPEFRRQFPGRSVPL